MPTSMRNVDIVLLIALASFCLLSLRTGRDIAGSEGRVLLLRCVTYASALIQVILTCEALGLCATALMRSVTPIPRAQTAGRAHP